MKLKIYLITPLLVIEGSTTETAKDLDEVLDRLSVTKGIFSIGNYRIPYHAIRLIEQVEES